MHQLPPCIDHAVVGMAVDGEGEDALLGILMRDVGAALIPEGDEVVPIELHRAFVDHLAALSARFWGWRDDIGLCTMAERLRFFAPDNIAPELTPGPTCRRRSSSRATAGRASRRGPRSCTRCVDGDPRRPRAA